MTGAIASEIRKLRTVRTTWVMTLMGWALVVLASSVLVFREDVVGPFTGSDVQLAVAVDQIGAASMIVLLVAILVVTTEFRHGTIGRTLQLIPSRTKVLSAKMAATGLYTLFFFVTGLVLTGAILLLGQLLDGARLDVGAETMTSLWQVPTALVLTASLGVAVGALLRSQVVAITGTLIWLFIAENLAAALLPSLGRWLPFQALNAVFLSPEALEGAPAGQVMPLAPGVGLATFLGYVVVMVVAAGVLMRTRDV